VEKSFTQTQGEPMNTKPFYRRLITLAVVCASIGAALTGCQGTPPAAAPPPAASTPATNWSNFYYIGGSPSALTISATVTQTGPPQWCYSVQSFSFNSGGTNFMPRTPLPGNPGFGFGDSGSFTNIDVSAPGCSGTISTPGWSVVAGSQVSFTYAGAAPKSSLVQFCLSCDKTNGTVTIKVTDAKGDVTSIGPIAGPQ
jgi:hypothetical protein